MYLDIWPFIIQDILFAVCELRTINNIIRPNEYMVDWTKDKALAAGGNAICIKFIF